MKKVNPNPGGQSAQSFDPIALAKMKVDTFNKTPGNLSGIKCPRCLDRGAIAILKEDGNISIQGCDCMKARRCVWELEASGLSDHIREKNFDAYIADSMSFEPSAPTA